ncbi:MAG: peptidase MA family metallohydrolase [Chloroflexota bacterium]|nr:peptidase MA family metallohydrolase [Chloroflexota bacterium]
MAVCSLLIALIAFALPGAAAAQEVPNAGTAAGLQSDSAAQVEFGSEIRFRLRVQSDDPVTAVLFLYQVDDSTVQNTAMPTLQPGVAAVATYNWRVASVLVPGAEVRYQWQVETASGRRSTTAEQTVAYNDTRFTWREARGEGVTVYSPTADPQAGSALLEEARRTQARLSQTYGLTLDKPLKIYAYSRREDYASAVYTGRPLEPALTVGTDRIFVLAPGGTSGMTTALQGLRREIATAVFLQKTKNAYAEPPLWLAQGFSFVMGGEELSADTNRALGQIAQANKLLPLKSLSGSFPNNERDVNLAYVESASAVKFIADSYGADKLRALLVAFKEGNTVDDALKKGLGVTLDQFETRWKNALKSGRTAAPSAAPREGQSVPAGDGGIVDRMAGPALRYWQGVFGPNTQAVVLGVGGFVVLGVLVLVVGSGVSVWRRSRAEED